MTVKKRVFSLISELFGSTVMRKRERMREKNTNRFVPLFITKTTTTTEQMFRQVSFRSYVREKESKQCEYALFSC